MNTRKVFYIKHKLEGCNNLPIQTKAFEIIKKHHPKKLYKTTTNHILMFFSNLSLECFQELFTLVKTIKKVKTEKFVFDDKPLVDYEQKSLTSKHRAHIKKLNNKETTFYYKQHNAAERATW